MPPKTTELEPPRRGRGMDAENGGRQFRSKTIELGHTCAVWGHTWTSSLKLSADEQNWDPLGGRGMDAENGGRQVLSS